MILVPIVSGEPLGLDEAHCGILKDGRFVDLWSLPVFGLTVLPLVCTPGPDLLFVVSHAVAGGLHKVWRAVAGVLGGYVAHGILASLGLAAVVAASPLLFEAMRWLGVAYLLWLAVKLIRSALSSGPVRPPPPTGGRIVAQGFVTSFLNPKGLLMYFSILPQFVDPAGSVALQAALLSIIFVGLCSLVYGLAGLGAARIAGSRTMNHQRRRALEGGAGGLLVVAAGAIALS
jgi:threonine/homoserine/homoserine lactone efflux protein